MSGVGKWVFFYSVLIPKILLKKSSAFSLNFAIRGNFNRIIFQKKKRNSRKKNVNVSLFPFKKSNQNKKKNNFFS